MPEDVFRRRMGTVFRGVINDLKRDVPAAAADLGVEPAVIEAIIAGDIRPSAELLDRAVAIWPVNERDFFPLRDDAPDGVIVMRADESWATRRVLSRGGRDYYEYRDTAMSRVAMFRPEWIKMLHSVPGDDPDEPSVQWNNGHFLYQFTYFVGSVNYYYSWEGRRHCVAMSTGDSVSGLPYAPHSFARRGDEPGMILALTYGGRLLGDAQHELSALGADLAADFAFDLGDRGRACAALLRTAMDNTSYPAAYLSELCGLPAERLTALLDGQGQAGPDELERLAAALRVNVRDLLPIDPDERDGVVIVRSAEAPQWDYPASGRAHYRIKALAGTRVCPGTRALQFEVLGDDPAEGTLRAGLHQYAYVLGPAPVTLHWEHLGRRHQVVLAAGDSFYMKPQLAHALTVAGEEAARVLILRIAGKVSGDTRIEAAALGPAALRRTVNDSAQWYDPAGRTTAELPQRTVQS
jgi:methylphosphonate synthase